MDNEKKLFEVYILLKNHELQSFYTNFIHLLHIVEKGDLLNISCKNLQQIGIVSRSEIKKFEILVQDLKLNSSIKLNLDDEALLEEYTIESSIMQKDAVIISTSDIIVEHGVGAGQFGKVFKGVWERSSTNGAKSKIPVAIKTLTDGSEISWRKEVSIFTSLNQNHGNIIKFFGLLINENDEVKMVTEFAQYGSLLDRLRERSISSIGMLSQFAVQISSGMIYLHTNNLVHRDLSTRNILVTAKNQVKIADFGLSKILKDSEEEWIMETKEMLPIRWLSPEAYNSGIFTTASDVWSFAVVLWEMFTFGDVPWDGLNIDEVKVKVSNGEMLNEPQVCPHGFYDVMKICFNYEAASRPNFHMLYQELILRQPELSEVMLPSTNQYDLSTQKGDFITSIKPISSDPAGDLWLGQHERTLLFGRFSRQNTSTLKYTLESELSGTIESNLNEENMKVYIGDANMSGYVGDEPFYAVVEKDDDKENSPEESYYQVPRCSKKIADDSSSHMNDNKIYANLPLARSITKYNQEYLIARENFLKKNIKQEGFLSSCKRDFKDTDPVTQETVNDRITRNWDAFIRENESVSVDSIPKETDVYLKPIDVSKKANLMSVINSIDPYAKIKSLSQENIYENNFHLKNHLNNSVLTTAHSTGDLVNSSSKRPRPKPSRKLADENSKKVTEKNSNFEKKSISEKRSNFGKSSSFDKISKMDAYAASIKKDFSKHHEQLSLDQQNYEAVHTPFSGTMERRKIETKDISDHSGIRNEQYLMKFSHVIPVKRVDKVAVDKKLSSEAVQAPSAVSNPRVGQSSKTPKHYTYDPTAGLKDLPQTSKEKAKASVTNYTNNSWHMFDDCVKDNKKSDKSKKKSLGKEISWPIDAANMTKKNKENLSSQFQKIRKVIPSASITECLDALRYSNNNVQSAVKYIQVQKLTQLNLGFSFESCDKILTDNKGNYESSKKYIMADYLCKQFNDIHKNSIVQTLEENKWDLYISSVALFYRTCKEIGIEYKRAEYLLNENNDPIKALEVSKILRLAEITNQSEHFCFRALAHCEWKLERAVDYILAKAS